MKIQNQNLDPKQQQVRHHTYLGDGHTYLGDGHTYLEGGNTYLEGGHT